MNKAKKMGYLVDDIDAAESRRLVSIMAEFIDGFSMLNGNEPMVSIFGSAQVKPGEETFGQAEELGAKLARAGISVITGGGPGIMEAANKGAFEAGGSKSIGVAIDLPNEQPTNRYMSHQVRLRHFFVRKVMLVKYSQAFVLFPGGFGTLDELFEALNLMRTKRTAPFPVILVGKDFWIPLIEWMESQMAPAGYVGKDEVKAIYLTDDLDEVVKICQGSVDTNHNPWG